MSGQSQRTGVPATLARIAVLRASPADLPWSPRLAAGLVGLYFVVNVLLSPLGEQGMRIATLLGAGEIALLALFLWIVLSLWHFRNRFVQTFCATLGCGCGFSLLALPFAWALHRLGPERALSSILPLLFLVLVIWNFVVIVHILRSALDTRTHVSVGLNLIYMLCSFQLSLLVLGGAGGGA